MSKGIGSPETSAHRIHTGWTHQEREAERKADDGRLTLAGVFSLEEGVIRVEAGEKNPHR